MCIICGVRRKSCHVLRGPPFHYHNALTQVFLRSFSLCLLTFSLPLSPFLPQPPQFPSSTPLLHPSTLQHTATHCYRLQHTALEHTAPHYTTLHHTAPHCNTLQHTRADIRLLLALQHTATHCNTLRHTATHCNKLQHTATHCNTLQLHHTETHCNTLQFQHTATHLFSYGALFQGSSAQETSFCV